MNDLDDTHTEWGRGGFAPASEDKYFRVMMRQWVSAQAAPTPDIQTDLCASCDGQPCMPSLLPASACAVGAKVLPEDSIAGNGLEDDACNRLTILLPWAFLFGASRLRTRTSNPATPWLVWAVPLKAREFCSTTLNIVSLYPDHETADTTPA